MFKIDDVVISGKSVLPVVEGGKGIAVSTGQTAGAWACAGGVGTFSAVNADFYDENMKLTNCSFLGKTRKERREELVKNAIKGGITQAQIAHETSCGNGRIHMNILWEMGASREILKGILDKTSRIVHGVTCGAGMPYQLGEIASSYGVYYYPIVSSARAFAALFKRAYNKFTDFLGGVVYEDPWRAGGHNGISNMDDPKHPQSPYNRIAEIRKTMNSFGLTDVPIVIAGGVWWLKEWVEYIGNSDIGNVAFQFGTRPILVQENPLAKKWREVFMSLKKGDVKLTKLSPTGFYSSAVNNSFLKKLLDLNEREVAVSDDGKNTLSVFGRSFKVADNAFSKALGLIERGYTEAMLTPDNSIVYTTPEHAKQIREDQKNCCGCLSRCRFSSWSENENGSTGVLPDPRTFCIQKTLQAIGHGADPDDELMFAGHSAYRFATDPFYESGFIPTTKQLVNRIMSGA